MSRRVQENIVAFILLLFFIGMIIVSYEYGPRARMVPIPVAAVSAVILLVQIYLMNFREDINLNVDPTELLTGGQSKDSIEDAVAKAKADEVKVPRNTGVTEYFAILTVVVYLAITLLIGIMPAVFLFVLGYFIFITKLPWLKSVIATLLNTAVIYLFFGYLLEIQFYEGWLVKLFLG